MSVIYKWYWEPENIANWCCPQKYAKYCRDAWKKHIELGSVLLLSRHNAEGVTLCKTNVRFEVLTVTLIDAEYSYKRGYHGLPNMYDFCRKCYVFEYAKNRNPFNAVKTFINVNDDTTYFSWLVNACSIINWQWVKYLTWSVEGENPEPPHATTNEGRVSSFGTEQA